ncbi:MAG: FAD-dependent oxidoreductase [Burkholderiales bacterium]|nr:FAD-dependent oxidoreductase [Burkholderiales bacterium]
MSDGVIVVGAGHAAGAFAAALRQGGYADRITLIGAESLAPYQRPPLSKAWLKGETATDELLLRPLAFYAEKAIELRLATRVVSIDRAGRRVALDTGERLGYDRLVLATGSRLRPLDVPGVHSRGVFELRTVADAQNIKSALGPGKRLAVIGGGYIGLEVAASARALGAEVLLIERESRLLARVASATLSDYYARCHADHGVAIVLGATVAGFDEISGSLSGVRLADGRAFACELALVGIGALANDALAVAAGLDSRGGVVVDGTAMTSDPAIYAIGDCTSRPIPRYRRSMRLESVPNALEQAKQAAAAICGKPPPKPELPWFWSDQYDVRLQIAGLAIDVAQQVVRGDPGSGRFAVFHLDAAGCLQALEAVNSPAEFIAGRQWVAAHQVIDPARAADPALSVKHIVDPLAPGAAAGAAPA